MILIPKPFQGNLLNQAAYIDTVIDKVSLKLLTTLSTKQFQMVYKTILYEEGLFYIAPVYKLLFNKKFLDLPRDLVTVKKEVYVNSFKRSAVISHQTRFLSIVRALDENLTPGKITVEITQLAH